MTTSASARLFSGLRTRVAGHERLVLALILAVGLLVRLPLVYVDAHAGNDLETFVRWARTAHEQGLTKIYDGTGVDYGPLSAYLLAGAAFIEAHLPAGLRSGDGALITLIKLPSLLADVLTAALLAWALARRSRGLAIPILAFGLYLLNPAVWYVSSYWGQVDSVYTLFLVASVIALERGAVVSAWLAYACAITLKVVAISFAPLLIAWTLARHGWRRMITGLAVTLAAWAVIFSPWLITGRIGEVIHGAYLDVPNEPPRVVVSAYNFWYLLFAGRVRDASSHSHAPVLGITYQILGSVLFGAFVALVLGLALRRGSGLTLPAAALSLGMFMLLTQVHERYLFPALALVLLAAAGGWSRSERGTGLWWSYGLLTATFLFNLVTIASFAPSLWTNLVAAEADSAVVIVLKTLALGAAIANLAVLAWLVTRIAARGGEPTLVGRQV